MVFASFEFSAFNLLFSSGLIENKADSEPDITAQKKSRKNMIIAYIIVSDPIPANIISGNTKLGGSILFILIKMEGHRRLRVPNRVNYSLL